MWLWDGRGDATCIICREEMSAAKKLPCGHFFHVHCLRSWLERQQTCPTCRAPVFTPEIGPATGTEPAAPNQQAPQQGQQAAEGISVPLQICCRWCRTKFHEGACGLVDCLIAPLLLYPIAETLWDVLSKSISTADCFSTWCGLGGVQCIYAIVVILQSSPET